MLKEYDGKKPQLHGSVFVADGACIIGDVRIGRESSVWYNAVVRGDINRVYIGERSNIQDLSLLHVSHAHGVNVGSNVTVGHRATIHGANVEDYSLIGMGSILLDGTKIGPYCIVAAGSVILEGTEIPAGMLVAGTPGKVKRALTEDEREQLKESATKYVEYAKIIQR